MVSQLPANVNLVQLLAAAPGTALVGTEPFETVQSGTSVAVTALQILAFAQTNFTTPGLSVLGVTGTASGAVAAITGTANRVLVVNAGGTGLAFGALNLSAASAVTGNLPLADLATTAGLSVLGITGTAIGTVAAITGVANQALVVNAGGTGLVFGPLNLSAAAAVTGTLPFANVTSLTGLSVLGVTGTATGAMLAITGATDQVLRVAQGGTTLAFGAINLATTAAVTGLLANLNGGIGKNLALPLVTGGTTSLGLAFSSVTNLGVFAGTGAPALAAGTSSIYFRNDGSSNTTRLYINTNGSTTWAAVTA